MERTATTTTPTTTTTTSAMHTTTRSRRTTRGILSSMLTLTACFSVSQSTPTHQEHQQYVRMVQVGDRGETILDNANSTDPFLYAERFKEFRAKAKQERKEKYINRRKHHRKKKTPQSFLHKLSSNVHTHTLEQINATELLETSETRQLNWFGGSGAGAYSSGVLADPTEYYDKWAQAYRMLGGYIDCDHDKSDGSHDSGDNNNGGGEQDSACSRWMLWASYVNPNYQGNEYDEYFSDSPTSVLDCHSPDTDWVLLGVYRQEFYQFIEQISKHLWAIDEYEYVVALAGLAYMTDYDCFQVGNDNSGNAIYAGVDPQPFGKFEMALYTDSYCLEPDTSLDITFDDYGLTSNVQLSSGDEGDDNYGDDDVYDWWTSSQEYTLTNLNEVYEEFKYCTSCVDYPTYQDGYFIGDYGTDDDDLINQCWKFYSHDSYTCEAECIAMAHAQGNILSIKYGDTVFGKAMNGFYSKTSSTDSGGAESKLSRLLANSFLGISFVLFITTFLAFAVARRSRYRDRSSRSRRLLDGEQRSSSRRSKSRSKRSSSNRRSADDDGLFRSSTRSKSRSRKASSSSKRKKSASKSRDRADGASF